MLQADFNILHLASHWKLTPGFPQLSWLHLGDRTKHTLEELRTQKMSFSRLDLVTLAACQTGVGGGLESSSREMESLAATVQSRGAGAVMGSLWNVSDRSTSVLMSSFYVKRTRAQLNKAEALRQAQLDMLGSSNWHHPYHWAPFVVLGPTSSSLQTTPPRFSQPGMRSW